MRMSLFLGALALLAMAFSEARADEKSHRKAAEVMLIASNVDKAMQFAVDQQLATQLQTNPRLAPYKEVMKKFLSKHLSYDALKEDLIGIYTAEFTEAELNQITAFYQTPAGKKSLEKMPALMQKGAELGMKRVQSNLLELKKMIDEENRNKGSKQR